MSNRHLPTGSLAWQAVLAAVAVGGSFATACMLPFVAVAVASAATLSRGRAATTVAGVWAVNQLIGFGLLGYPVTAYTFAWGAALLVAPLAAMLVAARVLGPHDRSPAALALAFLAGFAVYEGALFGFALLEGGTGTFTAAIIARILANDAGWFVALTVVHAVLTRAAPRTFGAVQPA